MSIYRDSGQRGADSGARPTGPSQSRPSFRPDPKDDRYSEANSLHHCSNPTSSIPKGPRSRKFSSGRSSRRGGRRGEPKYIDSRDVSPHSVSSYKEETDDSRLVLPPMDGSDPLTGINADDSRFELQMHNRGYLVLRPFSAPIDVLKNYKVTYDPELDKSLSKNERKAKHRKLQFQVQSLGEPQGRGTDPRLKMGLHIYMTKPHKSSKKMPFKQLPRARFSYDKDSLGAPPQSELVAWNLPASTSEVYLLNFFGSFGNPVHSIKFINDPVNAVPLGIATFSFQGTLEKALQIAKSFIKKVRAEPQKVDGVDLKIALNDADDRLLNSKVQMAQEKMRNEHISREKEEKRRMEAQKKKDEPPTSANSAVSGATSGAVAAASVETPKEDVDPLKSLENTTTLSFRHKSKVIKGVQIPPGLGKYIKERPFIYINQKYVPTTKILTQDVKKVLMKYDWTRVLLDRTGFYVVFNTLKECYRCFTKEDGLRFFEYRMYMEMCVPENFKENFKENGVLGSNSANNGGNDVDEGVNLLIKDFQTFLSKDIRERIIAPAILDLLNPIAYPELVNVLKEQEKERELQRQKASELSKVNLGGPSLSVSWLHHNLVSAGYSKLQKGPESNNYVMSLPSFSKKLGSFSSNTKQRKSLFPMQHALNYDDNESEDSDEEDSSRGATPLPASKRELESPPTPQEDEPKKRQKTSRLRQSLLYDETSDEEMDKKAEAKVEEPLEMEKTVLDSKEGEILSSSEVDLRFECTESQFPKLAYAEEEPQPGSIFDFARFQQIIKDDEDLALARKVFEDVKPSTIKHPEYWAWKQCQAVSNAIVSEEEFMGLLSEHLECDSGSFKSQGFRKIADADKIEYLPHRRKIHKPLKTVHIDAEEYTANNNNNSNNNGINNGSNNSNNANNNSMNNSTNSAGNVQSSRVNRANNRRFAADISAQKQILSSELDILNLNALNKRKKPVSFARSAIHNWGLYSLEPIAAKEMIIEYVGESIRQRVAEHREKSYLRTGIGSSYLFRIDENIVIDATKKGGIARFINHCCNPSCTAKIIKVDGKRRIVIYALRDIDANEELTYDYKFERETNDEERIRCLCGAPGCKGYLN